MLFASPPVFNTATYILVVCVEKVNVEVTPAGVLTWWMASEESGGGGGGDGGGGGVWHSTLAIQLKLTRMTSQTLQGAPPGCPRITLLLLRQCTPCLTAASSLGVKASQSVSQLFHGPAPRSPLHRLAVRLRHSRSNTSTEYSLPGATQLSQVRSVSPSGLACSSHSVSASLLRRHRERFFWKAVVSLNL